MALVFSDSLKSNSSWTLSEGTPQDSPGSSNPLLKLLLKTTQQQQDQLKSVTGFSWKYYGEVFNHINFPHLLNLVLFSDKSLNNLKIEFVGLPFWSGV